jgi:hypothetical protein
VMLSSELVVLCSEVVSLAYRMHSVKLPVSAFLSLLIVHTRR